MKTVAFIYRPVNSLRGINPNEICMTKNYNLFKPLFGNRGKENGFDEKRVQTLVNMIIAGTFIFDLSIIMVNKKGICIDGVNRIEALKRTNNYVIFRVVANLAVNGTESNTLNIVSEVNDYDTRWKPTEVYNTAFMTGKPLAELIDIMRADVISHNEKLSAKDLKTNLMMTLLERNKNKTHSLKRKLKEYDNEEYLAYAKTEQFRKELEYICKVIAYFKDSRFEANRIVEQLLFIMWSVENFDKDLFFRNLLKHGFDIPIVKSNVIRAKIAELATVNVPNKKKIK